MKRTRIANKFKRGLAALLAGLALSAAANAAGAPGVAQSPLFLTLGIKPNIILSLDDSGSMDYETVFPTNNGVLWWLQGHADSWADQRNHFVGRDKDGNVVGGDTFNFNRTYSFYKRDVFSNLFPIDQCPNIRSHGRLRQNISVPPLAVYAFARSSDYNKLYFDPAVQYRPWVKADGSRYPQIEPGSAPLDPKDTASQTLDLTKERKDDERACGFRIEKGMVVPKGTVDDRTGDWLPEPSDYSPASYVQVRIPYFPATFWLKSPDELPADYGYKATPMSGGGPAGERMYGYEIKPGNFTDDRHYQTAIDNFANWFSYDRKRYLATRGAVAESFNHVRDARVGEFTINNWDKIGNNLRMFEIDKAADRAAFYDKILSLTTGGSTPNRHAVNAMGQQYENNDNAIQYACQRNYGILFTDGYSDVRNLKVGNQDGSLGEPFADNHSNTIADIASKYYQHNLRTDLTAPRQNLLQQLPPGCLNADGSIKNNPPKNLDCEPFPHMQFFAVTLGGQQGTVYNVNQAATADPFGQITSPDFWPATANVHSPTAIDDLWHATLDARGQLLSADTAQQIADGLTQVLTTISQQSHSAASVAASSTQLNTGSMLYQGSFSGAKWSGDLAAYAVDKDSGAITATPAWRAGEKLPQAYYRRIFTLVDGGGAIFQWPNLSIREKIALDIPTGNQNDGWTLSAEQIQDLLQNGGALPLGRRYEGQRRKAYIRGARGYEGTKYRVRKTDSVLGDIVHSSPAYVGGQDYGYAGTSVPGHGSYAAYVKNKADSGTPRVYVGANDGMLHGFDADTGVESMAYVPQAVYPKLSALTDVDFNQKHQYTVDGSPAVSDAYIDSEWDTYLVGTLGAGGKGIFALKVSPDEKFAKKNVLWEFSKASISQPTNVDFNSPAVGTDGYNANAFADLGDSLSKPAIVALHNGDWGAVVSNGYDSQSGTAALYIINLANGHLIRELDTGRTGDDKNNGLSGALPVDVDGDGIYDYVYAGDLDGNLWKFNISSDDPDDWSVAGDDNGQPLFVACSDDTNDSACNGSRQPITATPDVGVYPSGGLMVYFGTGQYFSSGDQRVGDNPKTQSFYGIRDRSVALGDGASGDTFTTVKRRKLLKQQFLTISDSNGIDKDVYNDNVRVASTNKISDADDGWMIDLPLAGERQVSAPVLSNGRIIFTTTIPSSEPCRAGGDSYLIELNAYSGGRLSFTPFDLNHDRQFTQGDTVAYKPSDDKTVKVFASALKSKVGMTGTPTIVSLADPGNGQTANETKYLSGSSSRMQQVLENPGPSRGTQSWRQLR